MFRCGGEQMRSRQSLTNQIHFHVGGAPASFDQEAADRRLAAERRLGVKREDIAYQRGSLEAERRAALDAERQHMALAAYQEQRRQSEIAAYQDAWLRALLEAMYGARAVPARRDPHALAAPPEIKYYAGDGQGYYPGPEPDIDEYGDYDRQQHYLAPPPSRRLLQLGQAAAEAHRAYEQARRCR